MREYRRTLLALQGRQEEHLPKQKQNRQGRVHIFRNQDTPPCLRQRGDAHKAHRRGHTCRSLTFGIAASHSTAGASDAPMYEVV